MAVWAAIDREWGSLCERSSGRDVPSSWRRALPSYAVPPSTRERCFLADVCELVGRRDDDVASALVRLAQAGDQLAGRVMIQAMLPKLWAMSRRDPWHDFGDYVAAAWIRVMTFHAAARHHALLVNLCLDCLKQLSRQGAHDRRFPLSAPVCDSPDSAGYINQMVMLAVDYGMVSPRCGDVLHSVYCDGLTGREAAERHDISSEMVRYYCSSAIKTLRARRTELLELLGPCD
ncbi:MAG: hypothetical protein FWF28_07330 [Micrococcales bacterium]|nr:hypothetical protein [Micrococcales bacterium]